MLKSKIDKFLVKRTALFLILLTVADIAFLGSNKWFVLAGLLAGASLSIGRLVSNEWILKRTFELNGEKAVTGSIAAFTISQIVIIPVIVITYFFSTWLFYGLLAGIMVVPMIVMINSITEAIGITKNSFE